MKIIKKILLLLFFTSIFATTNTNKAQAKTLEIVTCLDIPIKSDNIIPDVILSLLDNPNKKSILANLGLLTAINSKLKLIPRRPFFPKFEWRDSFIKRNWKIFYIPKTPFFLFVPKRYFIRNKKHFEQVFCLNSFKEISLDVISKDVRIKPETTKTVHKINWKKALTTGACLTAQAAFSPLAFILFSSFCGISLIKDGYESPIARPFVKTEYISKPKRVNAHSNSLPLKKMIKFDEEIEKPITKNPNKEACAFYWLKEIFKTTAISGEKTKVNVHINSHGNEKIILAGMFKKYLFETLCFLSHNKAFDVQNVFLDSCNVSNAEYLSDFKSHAPYNFNLYILGIEGVNTTSCKGKESINFFNAVHSHKEDSSKALSALTDAMVDLKSTRENKKKFIPQLLPKHSKHFEFAEQAYEHIDIVSLLNREENIKPDDPIHKELRFMLFNMHETNIILLTNRKLLLSHAGPVLKDQLKKWKLIRITGTTFYYLIPKEYFFKKWGILKKAFPNTNKRVFYDNITTQAESESQEFDLKKLLSPDCFKENASDMPRIYFYFSGHGEKEEKIGGIFASEIPTLLTDLNGMLFPFACFDSCFAGGPENGKLLKATPSKTAIVTIGITNKKKNSSEKIFQNLPDIFKHAHKINLDLNNDNLCFKISERFLYSNNGSLLTKRKNLCENIPQFMLPRREKFQTLLNDKLIKKISEEASEHIIQNALACIFEKKLQKTELIIHPEKNTNRSEKIDEKYPDISDALKYYNKFDLSTKDYFFPTFISEGKQHIKKISLTKPDESNAGIAAFFKDAFCSTKTESTKSYTIKTLEGYNDFSPLFEILQKNLSDEQRETWEKEPCFEFKKQLENHKGKIVFKNVSISGFSNCMIISFDFDGSSWIYNSLENEYFWGFKKDDEMEDV